MTLLAELDEDERLAVELVEDIYLSVRSSRVLDSPQHWDRFCSRLQSAAWSSDLARCLTQLAWKLETPAITGDEIARALASPREQRSRLLRLLREETTALVALVRAIRDEKRRKP